MNPSGKFFLYYWTFKNTKFNSKFIYIYAFIYVGYTEKQYIEKQDALSAVSCSLRHSNEPATLLNERTNQNI